jgi:hypothetical protein
MKFMKDASTQAAINCILFSMKLKQTTQPYGKIAMTGWRPDPVVMLACQDFTF